ncbi:MAG: hypothetical protein ACYC5V_03065 [Gemmatimonadaceae bacterium]
MRYGRVLIALLIATAPAFAGAQRSSVNTRGERAGNVGGRGFALPRSSDLEDHSPVGVVLEKKKLALSDSQVTALKEIARQLHDTNADFYRMWDSVRVAMRSAGGGAFGAAGGGRGTAEITGMSPVDQERLATARTTSMGLMRAMREGDEWSRQETLKVLTAEQKPKAEEFWKEDAEDFGAKMPGGGMPRGGRPPGD